MRNFTPPSFLSTPREYGLGGLHFTRHFPCPLPHAPRWGRSLVGSCAYLCISSWGRHFVGNLTGGADREYHRFESIARNSPSTATQTVVTGKRNVMVPSSPNGPPPAEVMFRMITGYWVSQIIGVVAKLGIAEHLHGGAMSAGELARLTNADTSAPTIVSRSHR